MKNALMRSEAGVDKRCSWVNLNDPLLLEYHDREWGVPVHSDPKHFEGVVLSGAQAGLNWLLVLKKREGSKLGPHPIRHLDATAIVGRFDALQILAKIGDEVVVVFALALTILRFPVIE
jgi:hypothetical protein